ncbi:MAG: adenylate/guanylate cyclase domain-containing protein [Rhodobacterales bacterium]|nr:adenylate/guanylate cyclase domain-containing protein [Rhodobacterales bacterium]
MAPQHPAPPPPEAAPDKTLRRVMAVEERDGLRLAVRGRTIALVVIAVLVTFLAPPPRFLYYHALLAGFLALGLLMGWAGRRPWFRSWHLYALVFADFALLTFTLVYPNPMGPEGDPPQLTYRFGNAVYLFVLLAGMGFSYRPLLLLWGGLSGALCWTAGLMWILSLPDTVTSATPGLDLNEDQPWSIMSNPHFVDLGVRVQEVVVLLICAALLSVVVHRSRRLVNRQVQAVRDRHMVREALGKYVPEAVAQAIINDRGALAPQRRLATMLFADIEGFTGLVERTDPDQVVAMLNAYFTAVGEAVVAEGGVINQFQGDAVLVTFNLPLADPDHAAAAIRAARRMVALTRQGTFAGQTIRIRVGIATGDVVAGSVGSGRRLSYTVHGDAVNLAARLEQMNKETGTTLLVAEETVAACATDPGLSPIGEIPVRGRKAARVFTDLA